MDALRRASAVLFYVLGTLTILAIVFVSREMFTGPSSLFLNVVDLPLLFSGMLFGGTALVSSLGRGKPSAGLILTVFVPLALAFGFFAWVNFAMPFAER